jgi:hypothetical protein
MDGVIVQALGGYDRDETGVGLPLAQQIGDARRGHGQELDAITEHAVPESPDQGGGIEIGNGRDSKALHRDGHLARAASPPGKRRILAEEGDGSAAWPRTSATL